MLETYVDIVIVLDVHLAGFHPAVGCRLRDKCNKIIIRQTAGRACISPPSLEVVRDIGRRVRRCAFLPHPVINAERVKLYSQNTKLAQLCARLKTLIANDLGELVPVEADCRLFRGLTERFYHLRHYGLYALILADHDIVTGLRARPVADCRSIVVYDIERLRWVDEHLRDPDDPPFTPVLENSLAPCAVDFLEHGITVVELIDGLLKCPCVDLALIQTR